MSRHNQPVRHHSCTIVRTFVRTHMTLATDSGELREGHKETVTEACDKPLFLDTETASGVCRSCRSGWEVPDNRFASDAERQRATATT
jgi:hypothetical protein